MKNVLFSALKALMLLIVIGCSPHLNRPILTDGSKKEFFVDYQATVVFSPETTLNVTVQLPPKAKVGDTFYFPVQIPGSYEVKKYGKYISQFNAYGTNGKPIPCEKIDSSFYVFERSEPVCKITYTVHQTTRFKEDSIRPFAGTQIKSDYYA